MADRNRHPNKELEAAIRYAEAAGWRRTRGKGYFRLYCPCGIHIKSVALTPSNPNYKRNLISWFHRQDCWPTDQKGG